MIGGKKKEKDPQSHALAEIQTNPELAERYSAQSVPQTYAINRLIALGAQPEDLFMLSLEKMEHQTFFIPDSDAEEVEGGYKQIVTAAGHGSEAALAIFEDIINPYWKKEEE